MSADGVGNEAAVVDRLAAGREALRRGEWEAARACFEAALSGGESAEAMEALAMSAWWLDDASVTIEAGSRRTGCTATTMTRWVRREWRHG